MISRANPNHNTAFARTSRTRARTPKTYIPLRCLASRSRRLSSASAVRAGPGQERANQPTPFPTGTWTASLTARPASAIGEPRQDASQPAAAGGRRRPVPVAHTGPTARDILRHGDTRRSGLGAANGGREGLAPSRPVRRPMGHNRLRPAIQLCSCCSGDPAPCHRPGGPTPEPDLAGQDGGSACGSSRHRLRPAAGSHGKANRLDNPAANSAHHPTVACYFTMTPWLPLRAMPHPPTVPLS